MSNNSKLCKTILIGETGVGKTSIIARYINNKYEEGIMSTHGANYISKNVEFEEYNESINFQIWDTAGQEKYRGLTKIFYKDAKIIILVYDISSRKSFEEIKNYWYKQIMENSNEKISKIITFII
jgi:small GTP-binding protein